jgi:hypothetical protein
MNSRLLDAGDDPQHPTTAHAGVDLDAKHPLQPPYSRSDQFLLLLGRAPGHFSRTARSSST